MPRFLFLQHGNCATRPEMTPEQRESGMKAWMDWMNRGKAEGWLVDPGSPLGGEGAVIDPDLRVIDGPYTESKEIVGGYTMVEAADLAEAIEYAKQTMQMAGQGKIEVRQIMQPST